MSRLRRASKSRGAGRVEGVTCGKLAWGYVETGQEGKWNRDRKAIYKVSEQPLQEMGRARAAHRLWGWGAGRCGGQPFPGKHRLALGGCEA